MPCYLTFRRVSDIPYQLSHSDTNRRTGAAMAIEDGVALARALSKINNTEGINRDGVGANEVYRQ